MGWLALRDDRAVSLWNSLWLDQVPASRGRLRYVSKPLPCTGVSKAFNTFKHFCHDKNVPGYLFVDVYFLNSVKMCKVHSQSLKNVSYLREFIWKLNHVNWTGERGRDPAAMTHLPVYSTETMEGIKMYVNSLSHPGHGCCSVTTGLALNPSGCFISSDEAFWIEGRERSKEIN